VPAEPVSLPFHKSWPWDNDMKLNGLKIGWDVARPFMMEAVLRVLPPDLVQSGSDSNPDVGGRFQHFGFFCLEQL
jgi:hypothetical protein